MTYVVEDRVLDGVRIADDFCPISDNQCRGCKKEIVPYKEQYVFWDSDNFKAIYKYGCGYCRECSSKHEGVRQTPVVKETVSTLWGKADYYEDGSVVYDNPNDENWMY